MHFTQIQKIQHSYTPSNLEAGIRWGRLQCYQHNSINFDSVLYLYPQNRRRTVFLAQNSKIDAVIVLNFNRQNKLDICMSVHPCICVEKENQLDATEWFIALIICSTCFGNFCAHHQELETICVLLPTMVCSAWLLVVGGQVQGSMLCVQEEGCCSIRRATSLFLDAWPATLHPTPTTRNQSLHAIGGSNKHIVSSSWWWA